MYPAYSVIFFTTASGAGYALLVLMSLLGVLGILPAERWFGLTGFLAGLIAVTAGLLSSTYHLGRPERAWRAFSQWRSSWLSREGVLAVATFVPAGLTALGWVFLEQIWWLPRLVAGRSGDRHDLRHGDDLCRPEDRAALAQWLDPARLPRDGVLRAAACGWSCCAPCSGLPRPEPLLWLTLVSLFAASLVKLGYWRFVDTETGTATAGSATGLGRFGKVKLFAAPHTEENYLLKEMGFKIARKHALKLRQDRPALWASRRPSSLS